MKKTLEPIWCILLVCTFMTTTFIPNAIGSAIHDNEILTLPPLTAGQCDSLATRVRVNVGIGNNCETRIIPDYIFTGDSIPELNEIARFEYIDTNGLVRVDSIIPFYFVGRCIDVTAYVQGCTDVGGDLIPYTTTFCIEDKNPPSVMCAPIDTISCVESVLRLFTGSVSDCSKVDTLLLEEDIDELSSGPFIQSIRRVWQFRDAGGLLSDTCSQHILVRRLDFINQLMIPRDTILSCDSVGGIKADIPLDISGQVRIEGMPIGRNSTLCNTAAFHEDQIIVDSPCKRITLRKWTINEWRDGRDSILDRIQMITVVDTVAPVISGLPDTIRLSTSSSTCFAEATLPAIAFTEVCNLATVEVDIFTPVGAFRNQNGATVSLPVDTNQIYYTVSDVCHNSVRDTLVVIVSDATGPLGVCQTAISINIPTNVNDVTIPAERFDIHSVDGCHGVVTKQVRHMDSTILNDRITFSCNQIGDTIMTVLQLSDESGNTSVCMVRTAITGDTSMCRSGRAMVIDEEVLTGKKFNIGGLVYSHLGVGIPGITLKTDQNEFAETDSYGNFIFEELKGSRAYDISVKHETEFGIGVSTFDLLKIQRHIIGVDPLGDPNLEIAADVNDDKKVNALDLVLLRKHILGFSNLSNEDSWRFKNDSHENGKMGIQTIQNLTEDADIDFVGIKVGDVTGDAVDVMMASSRRRDQRVISYDVIALGGYKEISFKATEDMSISGLQAILNFNADILKLTNVNGAKLQFGKSHFNANVPGKVIISWASDDDVEVKKGQVLWRVILESTSGNEWKYDLGFHNDYNFLHSELYQDGEVYDLILERAVAPSEELSEIQNDPNPWGERTKLNFELPRSGMLELELYDAQNRLVLEKTKIFDEGTQSWTITNRDLSSNGVYFGKVSFEGKTRIFKMIKL